ncbi:hypothetical protein G7054_g12174 [Neopestalotiopsis clavispora]|nr:hypothetical protein G7054_g12174 [Neopestalotiopsis clavispora]
MESNILPQEIQWLQSANPSLTYRSPHSQNQAANFDHPHSCAHCQHLSVNAQDLVMKPGVFRDDGLYWRDSKFSFEIGRGLQQAIAASKAGCALFEWILDVLVDQRETIARGVESLDIDQILFSLEFEIDDHITCDIVINGLLRSGETFRPTTMSKSGLQWSRMDVCVRKDDPASNIISQRPPEYDMFSERSVQFGKECLSTCLTYHEQCRTEWLRADLSNVEKVTRQLESIQLPDETISMNDLPTRLLRIEADPDEALLVSLIEISKLATEEQGQVAAAGFAALSYCWGKEGNAIQLNSETYEELKQGIAVSMLPATISDAIQFSLQLSLEYIWVDALCIFQDDDQDKAIEIRRMGAYYGANTLTLCAASANGSSKGLRNPDANPVSVRSPLGLACRVDESIGQIILHPRSDIREHITKRGWTMQESLLSRRIMIFAHQLYWCCVSANAECEGPLAKLSKSANRNFGGPQSLVRGIHPAQVLRDYPPSIQWEMGVQDFTNRLLGVASDKLLAISAFASWVHARFWAFTGADLSYVAGLFMSTQEPYQLARQLLWRPRKTSDCTRPLNYRAPSWSWAAVDGELQVRFVDRWRPEHPTFVLEGFDLQLGYAEAPYGSVDRAALNISGCRIRPLQRCSSSHIHIEEDLDVLDSSNEGVSLLPDTPHDGHLIRSALDSSVTFPLLLCQIAISVAKEASDGHPRRPPSQGLMIMPVPGEGPNHFRRLGVFILHHVSHKGKKFESAELGSFFDVEGQSITLI